MSLHLLPRYRPEAVTGTVNAMALAEETMGADIRSRAIATLKAAMARRTLEPRDVVSAIKAGDAGIATLMRANQAPLYVPALPAESVPALPHASTDAAAINALVPWVRMLASEGHLSSAALLALSEPKQKPSTIYLIVATAWEAFKQHALAQVDLPKTLPPDTSCVFDVRPAPLADVGETQFADSSYYEPQGERPDGIALALHTLGMTHIGLRAHGEDYRALAGALDDVIKNMILPIMAPPSAICDDVYYAIEELVTDLETIALWDDAGNCTLPIQECMTFLEGFGYDEPDDDFIESLQTHIKWRRWTKSEPEHATGSDEAVAWRKTCSNPQFTALYDLAAECGELLKSLPKCKRMHPNSRGHMGVEQISIIPNGIGIDGWIEEAINAGYNAGDMVPDLSMIIEAKPVQLGQYATRAVIEVAIANVIAAHIELLD